MQIEPVALEKARISREKSINAINCCSLLVAQQESNGKLSKLINMLISAIVGMVLQAVQFGYTLLNRFMASLYVLILYLKTTDGAVSFFSGVLLWGRWQRSEV